MDALTATVAAAFDLEMEPVYEGPALPLCAWCDARLRTWRRVDGGTLPICPASQQYECDKRVLSQTRKPESEKERRAAPRRNAPKTTQPKRVWRSK